MLFFIHTEFAFCQCCTSLFLVFASVHEPESHDHLCKSGWTMSSLTMSVESNSSSCFDTLQWHTLQWHVTSKVIAFASRTVKAN